jgi:hypothetical protein
MKQSISDTATIPNMCAFVQERWLPEVAEFREIDHVAHATAV